MENTLQVANRINSEFLEDSSCFSWSINLASLQRGTPLESSEFKTGLSKELSWKLIIIRALNFTKLYLMLLKSRDIKTVAKCILKSQISLNYGTKHLTQKKEISVSFNVGGVLKLFECDLGITSGIFDITIIQNNIIDTVDDKLNKQLVQTKNNFLNHIETLFLQVKFSDVVLTTSGKMLNAHKNILASRSKVFKAMFDHNMKENIENIVSIDDAEYEEVKEMLRFIYCGKVDNIESHAENLLKLAEKYALSDLKTMCELSLARNLTKDNSMEMFKLAQLYNAKELQDAVIDFLIKNAK